MHYKNLPIKKILVVFFVLIGWCLNLQAEEGLTEEQALKIETITKALEQADTDKAQLVSDLINLAFEDESALVRKKAREIIHAFKKEQRALFVPILLQQLYKEKDKVSSIYPRQEITANIHFILEFLQQSDKKYIDAFVPDLIRESPLNRDYSPFGEQTKQRFEQLLTEIFSEWSTENVFKLIYPQMRVQAMAFGSIRQIDVAMNLLMATKTKEKKRSVISTLVKVVANDGNVISIADNPKDVAQAKKVASLMLSRLIQQDSEMTDFIDQEFKQWQDVESIDLRQVVCTLIQKNPEWIKFKKSESILSLKENEASAEDRISMQNSWDAAMLNLQMLFFLEAAPYCQELKDMPQKLTKLLLLYPETFKSTKKNNETAIKEFNEILEMFRAQHVPEKVIQNWIKMNAIEYETSKWTTADIYRVQFHLLLLQKLFQHLSIDDKARVHIQALIDKTTDEAFTLLEGVPEGEKADDRWETSAFTTYAFASFLIAIPKQFIAREAFVKGLTHLKLLVKTSKDPLALPYYPNAQEDPYHSMTPKASSARNLPVYLTLYVKDPNNTEYKKQLIAAIRNWTQHMTSLKLLVRFHNETHLAEDDDLAPYYFYASAIYQTAAIKLLLEEEDITQQEKEELLQLKQATIVGILGMLQKSGLFIPQGGSHFETSDSLYPSSPSYVNPLAGLALLPLIDNPSQKGSFGVLVR